MKKSILFAMTVIVAALSANSLYAQRGAGAGRGQGPAAGPAAIGRGTGSAVQPQGGGQPTVETGTAIQRNPKLMERLTPMLPPNTTLEAAYAGFKNQGQFIAALQISKNLEIPFDLLKTKMTGSDPVSLGQAIDELKPELTEVEVTVEVEKAEKQAQELQQQ
jgi:hypothetical protein